MASKPTRNKSATAAFTVMELLIGASVGMLVMAAVGSFFLFSLRSFGSMANYTDLNSKDRYASDLITRDVRNTTQVTGYTANQIQLKQFGGSNTVTYTYDPTLKTLIRADASSSRMLLTNVATCTF